MHQVHFVIYVQVEDDGRTSGAFLDDYDASAFPDGRVWDQDADRWRQATNEETEAAEAFVSSLLRGRKCSDCGLRDATPGRTDGLCSECFACAESPRTFRDDTATTPEGSEDDPR